MSAPLRIAQFAPLHESVPPKKYGGTERVVSYLTEALVALGHHVTLFASGDSQTSATLFPGAPAALRLNTDILDHNAPHVAMLEEMLRRVGEFDIVHLHTDYSPYPALRRQSVPFLSTLHGRLNLPEITRLYQLFDDVPLVSISDSQRGPMTGANFVATIQHGIPEDLLAPHPGTPSYLAFLGRISPEKGPDQAIAIARACGLPIRLAAKVDRADQAYFDSVIRPLLRPGEAEWIGEITEAQKPEFLAGAHALINPIDWPEPFGLVMIESMACGVPVIAYRRGSVPEVIEDGLTGFIVENAEGAHAAVGRLGELDRGAIRRRFEERFTARRMAEEYVALYRRLAQGA